MAKGLTLDLDVLVVREPHVEYEIDGGILVLRLRADRPVAVEDLKDGLLEALRDPGLLKPALLLLDTRGANENPPGNEMLRRAYLLAALVPRIAPRCAILTCSAFPRPLAGTIRAQAERQRLNIQVFQDVGQAKRWLLRGEEPAACRRASRDDQRGRRIPMDTGSRTPR